MLGPGLLALLNSLSPPNQQKEGNCSRKMQLIISEYRTLLLNYREGSGREISVICKPNNRGCAA